MRTLLPSPARPRQREMLVLLPSLLARADEVIEQAELLQCMSLLLAHFGPHAMSDLSPLSGVERKLDFGAVRSVLDIADVIPDCQPRPLQSAVLTYLIITGQGSIRASRAETKRLLHAGA
jgi:hypothetical protein